MPKFELPSRREPGERQVGARIGNFGLPDRDERVGGCYSFLWRGLYSLAVVIMVTATSPHSLGAGSTRSNASILLSPDGRPELLLAVAGR